MESIPVFWESDLQVHGKNAYKSKMCTWLLQSHSDSLELAIYLDKSALQLSQAVYFVLNHYDSKTHKLTKIGKEVLQLLPLIACKLEVFFGERLCLF